MVKYAVGTLLRSKTTSVNADLTSLRIFMSASQVCGKNRLVVPLLHYLVKLKTDASEPETLL